MLRQRIITAVTALLILLAVLFYLPQAVTRGVIAALMLAAAWEWAGLLSLQGALQKLVYVFLVAVVAGTVWTVGGNDVVYALVKVSVVWWSVAFIWILVYPTPIPRLAGWVTGLLVIIPAWAAIDLLFRMQAEILLFVLAIVWAADIGAYFAGKQFGRVKLAPQVSPGKSWEGVIGGMVAVTLLAGLVGTAREIDLAIFLPLCMAVAVVSVVGDLTVSMFKRSAGVKDSGTLFPGHGGVLDRIDSIMAAAPLFVFGAVWAGLG